MSASSDSHGRLGRLGRWAATHVRAVAIVWVVVALGLGALAPMAERALSWAGWEATGSESLSVRATADERFGGLSSSALQVVVRADRPIAGDAAARSVVDEAVRMLEADPRVAQVVPPAPGISISQDGRTAVIQAGAAVDSNDMVRAADDLKGPLGDLSDDGVRVSVTGASGMWSDFNAANLEAMLRSELISWPVTLAILMLAFGSLVAAGLPLMLTITGLMASAGSLWIGAQIFDVSIWAMNFALMFALALGIDYALFIVYRFRHALAHGRGTADAVADTMDTAGLAVLFSGLTVLISLSAVMLVPSPAFRSMALGIMLSVVFILAASLTLLPAVLAALGSRIDRLALPRVGAAGAHHSARFAAWGERLWRRPMAYGAVALVALLVLCLPLIGLRTGMPSIAVVPKDDGSRVAYAQIQEAFGPGAPGTLQVVAPSADAAAVARIAGEDPGVARVLDPMPGGSGLAMVQVVPAQDPSDPDVGATIDRLRADLPAAALVGGAAAENHDLEVALGDVTPVVMAVVLGLGFLLLLVALRAPVLAAVGVVTNLLAVGAAFGVARLIFQEGHLAGALGLEPQGYLDAWAPVFFFAMVFAISMDYTVFLLSAAKEHWDRTHDAHDAMVGALADSGRVIFAAAGVMIAVFFTFALSGPLPPKEMGVILGIAVLLDAALVRLLLVPVALRLLGARAWWLPALLRRVLPDIRFGHS